MWLRWVHRLPAAASWRYAWNLKFEVAAAAAAAAEDPCNCLEASAASAEWTGRPCLDVWVCCLSHSVSFISLLSNLSADVMWAHLKVYLKNEGLSHSQTTAQNSFLQTASCLQHKVYSSLTQGRIRWGKLHFFGNVADSSKILMWDKNMDGFHFSVRSVGCSIPALHEKFITFNGSDSEMPSLPSKASKTHPEISNTFCLHVVTVHIHHIIKLYFWHFLSITTPCHYAQTTSSSLFFTHNVNVSVAWWMCTFTTRRWSALEISGCVSEALDGGKGVSLSLPLNCSWVGRYLVTYWTHRRKRHLCSRLTSDFGWISNITKKVQFSFNKQEFWGVVHPPVNPSESNS